jgi:hypothetical protein
VEIEATFDYWSYVIPGAILTGTIIFVISIIVCLMTCFKKDEKPRRSSIKLDAHNFRLPVIDLKPSFSPRASFKAPTPEHEEDQN